MNDLIVAQFVAFLVSCGLGICASTNEWRQVESIFLFAAGLTSLAWAIIGVLAAHLVWVP